jgi:hypothetical protein
MMKYEKAVDNYYKDGEAGCMGEFILKARAAAVAEGRVREDDLHFDIDTFVYFKEISQRFNEDIDLNLEASELTDFIMRFAVEGLFEYPKDTKIPLQTYKAKAKAGSDVIFHGDDFHPAEGDPDPLYREKALAAAAHTLRYIGERFGFKVTIEPDYNLLSDERGGMAFACEAVDDAVRFAMAILMAEKVDAAK